MLWNSLSIFLCNFMSGVFWIIWGPSRTPFLSFPYTSSLRGPFFPCTTKVRGPHRPKFRIFKFFFRFFRSLLFTFFEGHKVCEIRCPFFYVFMAGFFCSFSFFIAKYTKDRLFDRFFVSFFWEVEWFFKKHEFALSVPLLTFSVNGVEIVCIL